EPDGSACTEEDGRARGDVERRGARAVRRRAAGRAEDLDTHADGRTRRARTGKESLETTATDHPRHRPEVEGRLPLECGWGGGDLGLRRRRDGEDQRYEENVFHA